MNIKPKSIGIRWTVGDVSACGFEALRISIWSAWNLFPERTHFAVCVNTISVEEARRRTGEIPASVQWVDTNRLLPAWLQEHVDPGMAEGVAWKLAPVRLFPDRYEIALDNDVILWRVPEAMELWLASDDSKDTIMAEDLQCCFGQFSGMCDSQPINSGIRGLPAGFDYEQRLKNILQGTDILLRSELDEQGLQAATLRQSNLALVSSSDVTICSAFPMHQHHLGRCGVHFVGLNRRTLPWTCDDGRPMHEAIREAWHMHSQQIKEMIFSKSERNGSVTNVSRVKTGTETNRLKQATE